VQAAELEGRPAVAPPRPGGEELKKDLSCVQIKGNFGTSNKLTTSCSVD
jgi:hypothetical protein